MNKPILQKLLLIFLVLGGPLLLLGINGMPEPVQERTYASEAEETYAVAIGIFSLVYIIISSIYLFNFLEKKNQGVKTVQQTKTNGN